MPGGEASPFFEKNPSVLGFSGDLGRNFKTTSLWKRAVVAIFFLAAILVILHALGRAPEKPKNRKSKRHLLGQDKMSAQNVHIIPEKRPTLREFRKDIGDHWAPRPFEPTAEKSRSSSENIATGQKSEAETKFISGLAKGLISSMRLKGIYMQPVSKRGNHLEEKFNYSKEINNLIQEGLHSVTKDGGRVLQKARGAPFKLPANNRRPKVPKPPPLTHSRPITILLDFYPMTRNKKLSQIEKFPDGEGKGLIMKLNLYPGKGAQPLETAERKSFGWFSKEKKKKTDVPKACSFLGLNPLGKRITAKWKNKNGDWIHAKRVSVKYWEKANSRNGRK